MEVDLALRKGGLSVFNHANTVQLFSLHGRSASVKFSRALDRRRQTKADTSMNLLSLNDFKQSNGPCAVTQLVPFRIKNAHIRRQITRTFQDAQFRILISRVNPCIPVHKTYDEGRQRDKNIEATVTDTHTDSLKQYKDDQDFIKAGGSQLNFVQMQALKNMQHTKIADQLKPLTGEEVLDLVIIGCGPAGLALAAEAAKHGLDVGIIGPDLPFTNNYGVWKDEFTALGLENCIEHVWKNTAVYLSLDHPILIKRAYGRVSRKILQEELLKRSAKVGVRYMDTKVERIIEENEKGSTVSCANGMMIPCRLVTVASGAASGRFLSYEPGAPGVCVQTAYGIEAEVESHPYDTDTMVFMDYRSCKRDLEMENCADEPPTFLYVMPLSTTRVFFEETCLAARPAMPFDLLKGRLQSRLEKMGIQIIRLYEEEWSYIPVGGSLPDTMQQHLGFGAAASMVHPATGYSVVRSLSEAPTYAAAIASALKAETKMLSLLKPVMCPRDAALKAWDSLWPQERKRQQAFFLFGLELILQLDLDGTRMFFETFFHLPQWLWKGFLAARLSSLELIWFAVAIFVIAPKHLRYRLVRHLMMDPSGTYLMHKYAQVWSL
eukprot:c27948_g2_i1 orf=254-2071(-)